MPQVTIQLLPVLKVGEGLQEKNGNDENNLVISNILNRNEGWTVVYRKKKKVDVGQNSKI
jgi:hypothetical protein